MAACLLVMALPLARFLLALFFCHTLCRALLFCHPDARRMRPGLVYLNLIPCFHYLWQLVTVFQVANSLQAEFQSRDMDDGDTDYGRTVGLAFAVLAFIDTPVLIALEMAGVAVDFSRMGLVVWAIFNLAWFCLFVMYWTRVADLSKRIEDDNVFLAHQVSGTETDCD